MAQALLIAIENLENQEHYQRPRERRGIHKNAFRFLSDRKFIKTFRLSKELVRELITLLEPFVVQGHRSNSLTLEEKVSHVLSVIVMNQYRSF